MSSNKSDIVLLPVQSDLAYKIIYRRKRAEFRKNHFPTHIKKAAVYATRPISKIIGWVNVLEVTQFNNPCQLWQQHGHQGCITSEEFNKYYNYGDKPRMLWLDNPVLFSHSFPVSFLDPKKVAPQSFRYLTKEEFELAVVCGNNPVSALRRDPITGRIMGL